MNFLFITTVLFMLTALQARLPGAAWLGGLRLELVPALVVYAALTLRTGGAIAFAFAAGLLQDSLSAGPFGLNAVVYATITAVLTGLHDVLDRELPWMQMGAGALMTGAATTAAGCVVGFSFGAVLKLAALVVFSTVITPAMFLGLDGLRYLFRRDA